MGNDALLLNCYAEEAGDGKMGEATKSEGIDQLKDKFIQACRILMSEGLIEGQYNISARLDKDHMLINDNVGPLLITRDNILTNTFEGEVLVGNVHPAIYKARPDVNAIIHAHPLHAVVLSTTDDELVPVHNAGALFHDKIKVYKSHGQVNNKERAEDIARLLGDGTVILQRGHGTIVVGKSLEKAVLTTIYLEEAAKVHFMTKIMGKPCYFTQEESEKVSQQVFKERSVKKAWDHYVSKMNWQMKGL